MLEDFEQSERPSSGRSKSIIAILVSLGLVLGGLGAGFVLFRDAVGGAIDSLNARLFVPDYDGQPGPPTVIVIEPGDLGEDVARKLVEADVVKSFDAIYRPMLSADLVIFPGHYEFPTQIPGAEALALLLEGKNRIVLNTVIPEGWQIAQIVPRLVADLQLDEAELLAAIAEANERFEGPTLEGYLFPASYNFDPGVSAATVVEIMLERMAAELAGYDLKLEDAHEVLTLASMIQMEGRLEPDFFKVSRVFANRLEIGMALQSDPTVKYYYEGSIDSFQQGVADTDNPYNTYVYPGLPPGPISSPGALAIEAALSPAAGEWLYFVSINLATGETVFSNTLAEHERAAELYRQWLRDNPGWDD